MPPDSYLRGVRPCGETASIHVDRVTHSLVLQLERAAIGVAAVLKDALIWVGKVVRHVLQDGKRHGDKAVICLDALLRPGTRVDNASAFWRLPDLLHFRVVLDEVAKLCGEGVGGCGSVRPLAGTWWAACRRQHSSGY